MLLPCSRSARPQKGLARRPQWDQHGCRSTGRRYEQAWREHYYRNVLVRRAQWRISQATHEKEVRTGRKRAVKPSQSPFLEGVQYEQAAQTDYPAKPQRSDSQQAIQTGQPTRPQASHNRRRTLRGTLMIVTNREQSWGPFPETPVRLLKQTIQQGRSRRTGRRRTLSGTLRTCSR